MKQLHEFKTLQEAQDYKVTTGRMISPDMMVAILADSELFTKLTTEGTEASAALNAALQFGSEFNLIEGHPSSVVPILNKLTNMTTVLKEKLIGYANPTKKPYEGTTQEEHSESLRAEGAKGITSYNVNTLQYNDSESDVIGHFVNVAYRTYNYAVTFDTPPLFDCVVTVELESKGNHTDAQWIPETKLVRINVPAGTKAISDRFERTSNRHTRVKSSTVNQANMQYDLFVYGE